MNREIKFRVWDFNEEEYLFLDNEKGFDTGWLNTTGCEQFTGLKDRNEKDVYENDIFQVAGNKKYIVKYVSGGESNHEWYGGLFCLWLSDEVFFPFDEYAMKNGVVIGNIYNYNF